MVEMFNNMLILMLPYLPSLYQLERQICTIEAVLEKAVVQLILEIYPVFAYRLKENTLLLFTSNSCS